MVVVVHGLQLGLLLGGKDCPDLLVAFFFIGHGGTDLLDLRFLRIGQVQALEMTLVAVTAAAGAIGGCGLVRCRSVIREDRLEGDRGQCRANEKQREKGYLHIEKDTFIDLLVTIQVILFLDAHGSSSFLDFAQRFQWSI
jgi:hypothetical protein